MPKLNKQIKKHLLYLLGVSIAFILSVVGLDVINRNADKEILAYKEKYIEGQRQLLKEQQNQQNTQK